MQQVSISYYVTNYSCKIGAGLIDLASMPEVANFVSTSEGNNDLKPIFRPGALRKVAIH